MAKKSPHPHVSWRDGRPRFQPDQVLRAAGHKGRDLRHDDVAGVPGRWFTRGECVDWSEAFVKQLAAARQPPKRGEPAAPRRQLYTVAKLFEEWFSSPKFQRPEDPHAAARLQAGKLVYSAKTIKIYKQKARVIETHDPSLWAAPVDAISQPVTLGLYEELIRDRGRATAHGTILVLSSALAWGRRRGKFTFRHNQGVNPALDLGMSPPTARMRFGSRPEISALIAAADALGWFDMGDMIALGLWTGQRQEDRLLLVDKGLYNGRRVFRQTKTGAVVAVREAPELEARLRASAERRRLAGVVHPRVILDEQDAFCANQMTRKLAWRPFPDDGDRYRKRFAVLRERAAAGIIDCEATDARRKAAAATPQARKSNLVWKVAPCPSLLGGDGILPFQEADLRSTHVTWSAIAGSTIPEIIAVTGHTLASATNILKHYLVLHPEMSDSGIGKMVAWYEADGETEIGL